MPRLHRIEGFAQAAQLISRCRKPDDGKALSSWCKIRRTIDGITFFEVPHSSASEIQIGYLTPDNIFTFTLNNRRAHSVSPSLSKGLHKITPFSWYREGNHFYEVRHTKSQQGSNLFDGLKFNIVTGEVINPKVIDVKNTVRAARLEWLRSVRQYKQGIKVRAKLGVLDTVATEVVQERSSQNRFNWKQPDWFSDHWIDTFSNALKTQDFSLDMLKAFAQTADVSYWNRRVTGQDVVETVDKLIKDLSIHLRIRFGVFGDTDED